MPENLEEFAIFALGIIESLASGSMDPNRALALFFNAENCLHVRKAIKNETADRIMSHGVQLSDLFDVLPLREAKREFKNELKVMKALCLQLVEKKVGRARRALPTAKR
jgi:hypothetical protein